MMKRNVNIGKPRHARLHGCIAVAGALVAAALSFPAAASDESDIASWIRPVPSTAKMAEDGWYVWCGSLAKDDCGVYHLFYARWKKSLGFGSWMTSSEIAHATGPSPFGPWTHRDVALPPRGLEYWDGPCTHNPTVHRFGGKWYMYSYENICQYAKSLWRFPYQSQLLDVSLSPIRNVGRHRFEA